MARYRHPKHGYYVAGYGDDVAALKAAGWVLDVPAPAPAPAPQPTPEVKPAEPSEPSVQVEILPEVPPKRRYRHAK
jgi:hypothetical protein